MNLLLCFDEQTKKILENNCFDEAFFNKAKSRFIKTEFILQEITLIAEINYGKIIDIQDLKYYLSILSFETIVKILNFN